LRHIDSVSILLQKSALVVGLWLQSYVQTITAIDAAARQNNWLRWLRMTGKKQKQYHFENITSESVELDSPRIRENTKVRLSCLTRKKFLQKNIGGVSKARIKKANDLKFLIVPVEQLADYNYITDILIFCL
jgi:hypothetical protein